MMRGYSRMRASGCTGFGEQEGDTYLLEEADLWTSKENCRSISRSAVSSEASTFVTAQDHLQADVQNWRKDEHLRWFKSKEKKTGGAQIPFCDGEAYTQSVIKAMMPSEFRIERVSSMREPLTQSRQDRDDRSSQKSSKRGGAFGIALQRAMSLREGGEGQQKESEVAGNVEEERLFVKDEKGLSETTVEAAVRRAFAMKDSSATASMGLQRSASEREHGSMADQKRKESAREAIFRSDLPAALLLKRANPKDWQGRGESVEGRSGRYMHNAKERHWNGVAEEVHVSPGEKRWEEAAEDEERRSRVGLHSQSMRCDKVAESVALAAEEDEEWAVYTRSGYIGVMPRARKGAEDWCCAAQRRRQGATARSFSIRDGVPPLTVVVDCAACGGALHGGAAALPARLLCSCCASSTSFVPLPPLSKKKGGVLRACRRLLGLARKRPSASTSASG